MRAVRRLLACLVFLIIADQAVVPVLRVAETRRYESTRVLRFENSDLFLLGPYTEYLQEHPTGSKPRVVFFGDSVVWGYGVRPHETIPAAFQQFAPSARVLNFGINGFGTESAFLMTKALGRAVHSVVVFHQSTQAHAMLPQIIEISQADAARFGLRQRSRCDRILQHMCGWWRLVRDSYRLQGAWFGTSARQYVYLHKGEWARALLGRREERVLAALAARPEEAARWEMPVARNLPDEVGAMLAQHEPLLWDFARQLRAQGVQGVFIDVARQHDAGDMPASWAQLNALFQPQVIFARVIVPDSWWQPQDPNHFTAEGCRGMAELLADHAAPSLVQP